MESIKLKNEKYWDATGVYDHTKQKTQDELNEEFDKTIQNLTSAMDEQVSAAVSDLKSAFNFLQYQVFQLILLQS